MTTLREAAQAALEALEIGRDAAAEVAAEIHAELAGYKPEEHIRVDAELAQIETALANLRAALAQDDPPRSVCDLLAIIHGDGGHYREQHGLDKAARAATFIVMEMRAALAERKEQE